MEIFGHSLQQEKNKKKERDSRKKNFKRLNKNRIIRDIRTSFEQKEEDYCKPKRVSNFWNNTYGRNMEDF